MIPNNWHIILERDNGFWKGQAKKKENTREIKVNTYDQPTLSFKECMDLLEERIKQ